MFIETKKLFIFFYLLDPGFFIVDVSHELVSGI